METANLKPRPPARHRETRSVSASGKAALPRQAAMGNIVFCLFMASLNFEMFSVLSVGYGVGANMTLTKLLGVLYFITMVPHFPSLVRASGSAPFLRPLWLFFGLLTAVSLFYLQGPFSKTEYLSIFQNLVLFSFLIAHVRKNPLILETGMLFFALGAAAQSGLFLAGIGLEDSGGRITIFGDNANIIGLRMGAGMVVLALAAAQNRLKLGKWRYLLLAPLPIMLQFMLATGSRVAMIAFALALVTGVLLFKTKQLLVKIGVLALGAICSYAVWLSLLSAETLSGRFLETIQSRNLAGRDDIWRNLLPLVASHPLFGSGLTGYAQYANTTFGSSTSPHNVLLEVLCYTGLVGLSIFLWFLGRVF